MPLTSAPVLPPELVWLIVEHIWDWHTLRLCALVSRTWAIPCQRALFRDLPLLRYLEVVRLSAHLIRYPHLQILIQRMSIWLTPPHSAAERNVYLSRLTAIFPLMPRLTYLHVRLDISRSHDQQFIEAFGAFVRTSQSLTELDIYNLRAEADFQQIFSCLEDSSVKRVSLDTQYFIPSDAPGVDFFSSNLGVVHRPALELLRVNMLYLPQVHTALRFWLRQYPTHLKHLEVDIPFFQPLNVNTQWFLQPAALQLESLTLELTYDRLPTYEGLFEGFHFKHFKLRISDFGIKRDDVQIVIDWLSSMFRYLADSRRTVHFVELTLTFVDINDTEAVSADWATLDEVLSHAAFTRVQRIHFEEDSDEQALVTDQGEPELASAIQRALPRLASRGVLCFE
ncbi:hypothetical protein BDZ89DRAFT_1158660 [Hymenopellis radicata]|nr:hypothetical protein BDZ89DRAFT_1158660 [Hymenopellis radicata]